MKYGSGTTPARPCQMWTGTRVCSWTWRTMMSLSGYARSRYVGHDARPDTGLTRPGRQLHHHDVDVSCLPTDTHAQRRQAGALGASPRSAGRHVRSRVDYPLQLEGGPDGNPSGRELGAELVPLVRTKCPSMESAAGIPKGQIAVHQLTSLG